MRLLFAAGLVLSMSGTEIERAQALARARDAERQQFHQRYVINLKDPVVAQIEVVTEFRRLVLLAEEHVFRGDWMFTRSIRAAEDALKPTRGLITLRAQVRFNPLNTFIEPPAYAFAVGAPAPASPLGALATQLMPQYSVPFRTREGRDLSSLLGVNLEANVPADRIGQTAQAVGVTLDGKEIARAVIDFTKLD